MFRHRKCFESHCLMFNPESQKLNSNNVCWTRASSSIHRDGWMVLCVVNSTLTIRTSLLNGCWSAKSSSLSLLIIKLYILCINKLERKMFGLIFLSSEKSSRYGFDLFFLPLLLLPLLLYLPRRFLLVHFPAQQGDCSHLRNGG